jgi:hypothetical protein
MQHKNSHHMSVTPKRGEGNVAGRHAKGRVERERERERERYKKREKAGNKQAADREDRPATRA